MIVDTSAIVAILTGGPDGDDLLEALAGAAGAKISAGTLLEAGAVLTNRALPQQGRRLDDFLAAVGVSIVPFDEEQAQIARQAYADFGRGSGHPAHLTCGDCFAYALHRVTGEPLLFKGGHFAAAGVPSALDT